MFSCFRLSHNENFFLPELFLSTLTLGQEKGNMSSNIRESTVKEPLLLLKRYVYLHSNGLLDTYVQQVHCNRIVVLSSPKGKCQKTEEEQRGMFLFYNLLIIRNLDCIGLCLKKQRPCYDINDCWTEPTSEFHFFGGRGGIVMPINMAIAKSNAIAENGA